MGELPDWLTCKPVIYLVVRLIWDSEEEDEMRKGRGCMLHYQSSPLRVLTPFIAQADGGASIAYFLGPDWQVNGCFPAAGHTGWLVLMGSHVTQLSLT